MDNRELDRAIAERFLKWYEVGDWWFDPEGFITEWRIDSFNPTENPLACSLVLDEIERHEWNWEWRRDWDWWEFTIYDRPVARARMLGSAMGDNRYKVVCMAALETIENLPALQAAEGERK